MVDCVVGGNPSPTVVWLYHINKTEISCNSSERVHSLSNGTIVFNTAQKYDTAAYNCVAKNLAGESAWSMAIIVEGKQYQ